MPRRRSLPASAVLVMMLAVVLALSGCQVPFGPQAHVSGTVYGEEIAAREAGKSVPIPLQATVTCNGSSVSSDNNGTYSLMIPQTSDYTCTATARTYSSVTAHFSEGSAFTLNFGPKKADQCAANAANTLLTCDLLSPAKATLRGTVTNASTDKALPRVEVQCWNAAADFDTNAGSPLVSTITDDMGNYVFHNLPVDPFGCVADTDQTLQYAVLKPGIDTTLDLPVCASKCPTLGLHNGTIMHHLTVYLDFWLPSGFTFEPNGSSRHFEQLMAQYFQDVGGTPFYNILTQYYDVPGGPVRNTVTYGGSYVDTRSYPRAGTQWDPLYDSDIRDEISHVMGAKHAWTPDPDHLFFV
ncbi:MAG TPA: carboxypeptidase-like regulatory domain-containing protein, partial [Ktedonobacterales bacterium]|nr:carboxypeptidase-like regulatory domain-containing protein [Ktedonobacterales bacterium]